MKNESNVPVRFFFAIMLAVGALGAFQLQGTDVFAQSSFFSSRGCVDCHSAPTAATCAGCHEHSGSLTATKNKTTSYAPGETVTITLTSSGARSGWIGVRLYNQSGVEVARSTGTQSGMGGSATFGAASAVSAPAPAAAGNYTWRIAYLGNENGDGSGDVHSEISVNVPITVASAAPPADTAAPVVTFSLPATATSLTVPVTLSATDNVAVNGYLVNKVATPPAATAAGWTAAAPASVTAVAGSNTFYAWARDAAGNVSAVKSATVVVTLPDTAAPVVTFSLPATATSLTVPVTLSATDNVAVNGYLVNKVATPPAASAAGWTAAAPASVTAVAGSNTFYAWAKDAAGNVSAVKSATVVVTLPDTAAPVVTFSLPATATSLTVPVSLSATDNVAVSGYLVNSSATPPAATAAGWTAAAPASVTAVAGSNTFYAWAKDAAGNVSAVKSATVVVTLPDTAAPVVTFSLPATATSLTVPVSLSATDNVAVNGYLVNKVATPPAASAAGWTAAAPASVTAVAGSNTFYAWAKDAVGNVSAVKSATVVVTLPDTAAPVVTFSIPATATSLTVPVSLSATDNVAVNGYLVNKVATPPAASAAGWTAAAPASVTAVAGSNTFYAWAKDAVGNVSAVKSATVVVTLPEEPPVTDTTKPTLTISSLANNSFTNKVTLNVSGNASDDKGLKSVTVNDQAVTVNPDGSFSYALTLEAGANTITTIASDDAGNQQVDTRTVTYDANAPVLAVSAPADNSNTIQSFVTVTGTINETSTVSVSSNSGSPQSATINGNTYSATVNLVAGVNTIDITATDQAGNTSNAKRTITRDSSNSTFTLAVTNPAQDITTRSPYLTLKGTVVDATSRVSVRISMDGKIYSPRVYNGAYQQRLTFYRAKQYAITVTAKDEAGNISTVKRNVIYRPDRDDDDDERDDD